MMQIRNLSYHYKGCPWIAMKTMTASMFNVI